MIVSVKGLNKSFGKNHILHDISLEIEKGDIFGLVGPDGAGKTTLIRTILDLYLPDTGTVHLFEQDDIREAKRRLGYVPQEFSLNTDMTVWENIALFAELQGMTDFADRAEQLLQMVWLSNFKDRLAGKLSGGMKQKLSLVCSVIHKPELLVLDEPTTGVDPVSRREFWQMLYRLNKDGLTILISTPYMDEVELCTKLTFLHLGKIRAFGSPDQLLATYPYKLAAISAPDIRTKINELYKLPAHSIYFKGDKLVVSFSENNDLQEFKVQLVQTGLQNIRIKEVLPTLEDLFSVLSEGGDLQ